MEIDPSGHTNINIDLNSVVHYSIRLFIYNSIAVTALLQQDRPFVANNTDLTVWIDLEFMIPENYDMTVCCRTSSFRLGVLEVHYKKQDVKV